MFRKAPKMNLFFMLKRPAYVAATCFVAILATNIHVASATNFSEPSLWSVGDLNSTYQEWGAGGTSASPVHANLTHTANPTQSAPTFSQVGGFVASSGGYYSFSGNYAITAEINAPTAAGLGTYVTIQTAATLNPDYDPENNGTGGSVLQDSIQILDANGDPLAISNAGDVLRMFYDDDFPLFGGVQYEELVWNVFLPGYSGDFDVKFDVMVHSSLQAVRVDSFVKVPEPNSIVIIGIGSLLAAGAGWMRRRKATTS